MASRKRTATNPVDRRPAKQKERDDRPQRRATILDQTFPNEAARHQAFHDEALCEQAYRDKISERNAINSPLICLPAEIRNTIYAYVLTGDDKTRPLDYTFEPRKIITPRWQNPDPLGLLFVSRQLHAETALLPYKLNPFSMDCLGPLPVKEFLQKRTKMQMEAIVRLEFYMFCDDERILVYKGKGSDWAARLSEDNFEKWLLEG